MPSTSFIQDSVDTNLGVTASPGGTQASATPCIVGINTITTVAVAGHSVILPAGCPKGTRVVVANLAANKADIFPNVGGRINTAAVNADLGIAGVTVAEFIQIGDTGLTWLATGVSAVAT